MSGENLGSIYITEEDVEKETEKRAQEGKEGSGGIKKGYVKDPERAHDYATLLNRAFDMELADERIAKTGLTPDQERNVQMFREAFNNEETGNHLPIKVDDEGHEYVILTVGQESVGGSHDKCFLFHSKYGPIKFNIRANQSSLPLKDIMNLDLINAKVLSSFPQETSINEKKDCKSVVFGEIFSGEVNPSYRVLLKYDSSVMMEKMHFQVDGDLEQIISALRDTVSRNKATERLGNQEGTRGIADKLSAGLRS